MALLQKNELLVIYMKHGNHIKISRKFLTFFIYSLKKALTNFKNMSFSRENSNAIAMLYEDPEKTYFRGLSAYYPR